MTTIQPAGSEALDASLLVERWRIESAACGWRFASDWHHPVVEELASVALLDEDPALSIHMMLLVGALGQARGYDGVGLTEGLDDLRAFVHAAQLHQVPHHWVREYVEGWSDQTAAGGMWERRAAGTVPRAGLEQRIREIYDRADALSANPAAVHKVIILDDRELDLDPETLLVARESFFAELRDKASRGETVAVMPRRLVVVLAYQGPDELTSESVFASYRGVLDTLGRGWQGAGPFVEEIDLEEDVDAMMHRIDVADFERADRSRRDRDAA